MYLNRSHSSHGTGSYKGPYRYIFKNREIFEPHEQTKTTKHEVPVLGHVQLKIIDVCLFRNKIQMLDVLLICFMKLIIAGLALFMI